MLGEVKIATNKAPTKYIVNAIQMTTRFTRMGAVVKIA